MLFNQLKTLLWRNAVLKRRALFSTLLEIIIPTIIIIIMGLSSKNKTEKEEYSTIQNENLISYDNPDNTFQEYNSNFDFDFLKKKSFFECLNIPIIFSILEEQLKNSKAEIKKCGNEANELLLSIKLNKNDEALDLIIPKYEKNLHLDKEEILKLKTLCFNLLYVKNKFVGTEGNLNEDNEGFTNKIIKNKNEMNTLLNWINKPSGIKLKVKLLYTPTLEKNSWRDFHNYCDEKGPTIILCESTSGNRFGGYTSVSWDLKNTSYSDSNAFLFSLDNNKKYSQGIDKQIYCGNNHGPHFHGPSLGLNKSKNHAKITKYQLVHDMFNIIGLIPYSHLDGHALEGDCKYESFTEEALDQSICELIAVLCCIPKYIFGFR